MGDEAVESYRINADEEQVRLEQERLLTLARVIDPATKAVLAPLVRPGWHCCDVGSGAGTVVQWLAEGQAPNVIFPGGYRRDSFKPGDQVSVTVEPVKNGVPAGRILESVLANGTKLGRASSAGSDEAIIRREN